MNNSIPKERLQWMDLARGLCILLVVILHGSVAVSAVGGIDVPKALDTFNRFLDPHRMPMLMFLSGMLLGKSLNKSAHDYVSGKMAQIYWPFLIFSLTVLLAEDRFTLGFVLKTPISSPTLLWYLWFICAYYLIALVIHRLSIPLLPVIVASLLAAPFLPDFMRMARFAYLFAFFLAGHAYVVNRHRIRLDGRIAVAALVAAAAGGVVSVAGSSVKYDTMFVWAPAALVVVVLFLSDRYVPHQGFRPLEWIGRNSIVFYVAHFQVQVVLTKLLVSVGVREFWVVFPAILGASLLAATALQLLRERYRPFAALFDGRLLLRRGNGRRLPSPVAR